MATTVAKPEVPKLPKPNGDFYQVTESLNDSERAILQKVRTFMESKVAPVINQHWLEDSFPFDLLPGFRDLQISGMGYQGYGCAGGSTLLAGFMAMEIARVDCSFATFFGSIAAWPWVRSSSADRKSKNRSGCHRWRVWKSRLLWLD